MRRHNTAKIAFLVLTLIALTVNLTSCATANFKLGRPGIEELKYKKISQADPLFWKDVDSIHASCKTNLSAAGIRATIGGDIDMGGTCSSVIKSIVPGVLVSGLNPIAGAMTIAQAAAEGPQRKNDTAFQENINAIVSSYDWDNYFAEVLQNKLGSAAKISVHSAAGKNLRTHKETDLFIKPNGRNIIYWLVVNLEGVVSSHGWTTPNASLITVVMALVVSNETMQEISELEDKDKASGSYTDLASYNILLEMNNPAERVNTTLSRLAFYKRAFKIDVFKKSKAYDKKTWLSDNGAFLQEKLRATLEDLAAGLAETAC